MASTRGSKILYYHGVSDPWFSALDTVDYYERMATSSGGLDQVRAKSSRVFLIPAWGIAERAPGPSIASTCCKPSSAGWNRTKRPIG